MGDFKGCDIHDKEFPHNLVPADSTVKIYVERKTKPEGGRTETTSLFVNGQEGADSCNDCMTNALLDRLLGIKTKFVWRKFYWENEEYTVQKGKDKGQTKERLVKHFIEE